MKFTNRETQYPGKRILIKVDEENEQLPNNPEILVKLIKDEGAVYEEGTPITADNLNKGNWRDDNSLSFQTRTDNDLPVAKNSETQIVTKVNGETWIVPPEGLGIGTKIVSIALGNGTAPGLSDNNYTTAEKNKVANIPQNVNDLLAVKASASHAATHRVGGSDPIGLGNGTTPGLSANDYASADKTKLNGIAANAQVNVIEGALLGNIDVQISSNKKLVLPAVVQQTGQSAAEIMSQKAVTDEVNKKFGVSDFYKIDVTSTSTNTTPLTTGITVTPTAGTYIRVKFTNAISRSAATNLTVNGINYAILVNGVSVGASPNNLVIPAGENRVFRYNGAQFELINGMMLGMDIQGNVKLSGYRTLWAGKMQIPRTSTTSPVNLDYTKIYRITWGWYGRNRKFEIERVADTGAISGYDAMPQWNDPWIGSIAVIRDEGAASTTITSGRVNLRSLNSSVDWENDPGAYLYKIEVLEQ